MATSYLHRVLLVVPSGRRTTFNTWIRGNLDPDGGDWLTTGLSSSGGTPFSHFWACASLTNPQLRLLMGRLCTLAGISQPADWDAYTRQQKKQRFLNQRAAIRSATGIWVDMMENDGVWNNPEDSLNTVGVRRPGLQ